jgi:preprotein translocase subunit SecE
MNSAVNFVKESYYELRKSSWLTKQEAIGSTRAVIILVALFAVYVAGIDFVLSIILQAVLGTGR